MFVVGRVAQAQPQPVECTNCTDDLGLVVAVIGAVLAAAALMVSFWSLYVSALRRPRIQMDYVAHSGELRFAGWSGGLPSPRAAVVDLWIVLANTGASGTFVETLALSESFTGHGPGAQVLARLERTNPHLRGRGGRSIEQPPLSFERGETVPYRLGAYLRVVDDVEDPEELARRLRGLEAVSVSVAWEYRRSNLLRPWKRETADGRETVRLPAEWLIKDAASHWRGFQESERFADTLEGRSTA